MSWTKEEVLQNLRDTYNPFTTTLHIKVIKKTDLDNAQISYWEVFPYTKLFVSASLRKAIAQLTPKATHLLIWMMMDIGTGEDIIYFKKQRYMEESGTSAPTLRTAIKELISKGFLSFTVVKDAYYINPEVFFKGSRPKKYPNKLKVINDEEEITVIKQEYGISEDDSIID